MFIKPGKARYELANAAVAVYCTVKMVAPKGATAEVVGSFGYSVDVSAIKASPACLPEGGLRLTDTLVLALS